MGDEVEQLPFELVLKQQSHFIEVEKDRVTVKYVGYGNHANDVGAVQASTPLPSKKLIYYFECTVLDSGQRGTISIGLTNSNFMLNRQPGWEADSYGYHGDDGRKFHDSGRGEAYGTPFGTDDTIGCGMHFENQEIFYTKNGKYLGPAFRGVSGTYYPTVGLHSPGERVMVNFGQNTFKFDIHGMIQEEREKKARDVSRIPVEVSGMNEVVRQYLEYYGYKETLGAFESACGSAGSSNEKLWLTERKHIREMILTGKIEDAVMFINKSFNGLLDRKPGVAFQLHCQNFIEMMKDGRVDDALLTAQKDLCKFRDGLSQDEQQHLTDVVALLAYNSPLESPLERLLGSEQREGVADAVNEAILDYNHIPTQSVLTKLLSQLVAAQGALRAENNSRGEVFQLNKISMS